MMLTLSSIYQRYVNQQMFRTLTLSSYYQHYTNQSNTIVLKTIIDKQKRQITHFQIVILTLQKNIVNATIKCNKTMLDQNLRVKREINVFIRLCFHKRASFSILKDQVITLSVKS